MNDLQSSCCPVIGSISIPSAVHTRVPVFTYLSYLQVVLFYNWIDMQQEYFAGVFLAPEYVLLEFL